jgi:hypothetical protein
MEFHYPGYSIHSVSIDMSSSLIGSVISLRRSAAGHIRRHLPSRSGAAWETVEKNGMLGFVCFGGPPVHFQIVRDFYESYIAPIAVSDPSQFHQRFVNKYQWVSEPMFQELFAVTQSLSGPASTKMLYCINLARNGFLAALSAFLLWS